jgi:hypothetical protein
MFQLTGLYLQPARVFFMHIHAARYKCGFNKNKNKKKLHLPGSWFCIAFGAHALGLAAVHPAQFVAPIDFDYGCVQTRGCGSGHLSMIGVSSRAFLRLCTLKFWP